MKKQYVTLRLRVMTFSEDVVTTSIFYNTYEFGVGVDATNTWWKSE